MTNVTILKKVEQQLIEEKNVSDSVLNKVRVLEAQGNLELPPDYSVSNAMKEAWLQISQDSKLMACTEGSKAQALLGMVTQGLNPAKKQCYFIPYGNKMQVQRSYHGNAMMLKRDAGAIDVIAQVIYEGDTFKQKLNGVGRVVAIEHEQDFFNINKENIKGAYCTIVFDGNKENYIEIMTIDQIKQAWLQSPMIKDEAALEKSKTHNNFKEEMAKKTVINRAAKRYINTSTDANLLKFAREEDNRQRKIILDAEEEANANKELLEFEEVPPKEATDVTDFEEVKDIKEEPAHQTAEDEEPF